VVANSEGGQNQRRIVGQTGRRDCLPEWLPFEISALRWSARFLTLGRLPGVFLGEQLTCRRKGDCLPKSVSRCWNCSHSVRTDRPLDIWIDIQTIYPVYSTPCFPLGGGPSRPVSALRTCKHFKHRRHRTLVSKATHNAWRASHRAPP
jgi:hypothetical protein